MKILQGVGIIILLFAVVFGLFQGAYGYDHTRKPNCVEAVVTKYQDKLGYYKYAYRECESYECNSAAREKISLNKKVTKIIKCLEGI